MGFFEWLEEQGIEEHALSEDDWDYYKSQWELDSRASY